MVAMKKQCHTLQIYELSTHIPRGLAAYLARRIQTEGLAIHPPSVAHPSATGYRA